MTTGMPHHGWSRPRFQHCRKNNPPTSNYGFSCGQRLTDGVIDTEGGIQQSVLRDNPDILRQIDERLAEMKRKGG